MIIVDTLRGAPEVKRAWPEVGMIEDISPAVRNIDVPTLVLCGENDQVERVETLKQELIPRIGGIHANQHTGFAPELCHVPINEVDFGPPPVLEVL